MHLAGRGKQGLTTGEELHADRGADVDAPVGEGERTGEGIAGVYLDAVVVAAGAEQVTAVRRNGEVTGVRARRLESGPLHLSRPGVYRENGDTVPTEPVARIEEATVRGEMYVRAAVPPAPVGRQGLDGRQGPVDMAKNDHLVAKLADEVGETAVGAESQVARTVGPFAEEAIP